MLYKILSEATSDQLALEKNPLYINFLNCKLNYVPEFLSGKKDIGVVLQKQFENLVIDYRGISVILFFDGRPHNLYIDILTIYSLEIVNRLKLEMDNRLSNNYISSILNTDENIYMKNMKELAIKMSNYEKNIVKLLPKQSDTETKKVSFVQIEDIIKPIIR